MRFTLDGNICGRGYFYNTTLVRCEFVPAGRAILWFLFLSKSFIFTDLSLGFYNPFENQATYYYCSYSTTVGAAYCHDGEIHNLLPVIILYLASSSAVPSLRWLLTTACCLLLAACCLLPYLPLRSPTSPYGPLLALTQGTMSAWLESTSTVTNVWLLLRAFILHLWAVECIMRVHIPR